MSIRTVHLTALLAVLSILFACAGREPAALKESPMTTLNGTSSADVVRAFFSAFGKGDVDGVLATFHPEAEIIAVRPAPLREGELYGRYEGKEGPRAFVDALGRTFNTKAFTVERVIGEGDVAFASGSFVHEVKATGKTFSSDWALRCVVKDGKILQYRFYEDSAAFVEANR